MSLLKKKYAWAVIFTFVLVCFTLYVVLDTFVIARTYGDASGKINFVDPSVDSQVRTSDTEVRDTSALQSENAETSESEKNGPVGTSSATDTIADQTLKGGTLTDSYSDENIKIDLYTYREYDTERYVADVVLSSAEYLKTAFANDTYGKNVKANTSDIAKAHNAIFAVNGDFYGAQTRGYVLRNGVAYRESSANKEDLVIYPDGSFEKSSSTGTRLWGNNFEITAGTRLSHGWGFYGNSAVYSRVGYFRCATTSNNARTHIVTPKLAGIPDGYTATIEVTVTDRMYETNGDVGVFVSSNLTMNSTTDPTSASFCKYTGSGALSNGHALGIGTGSWQTRSVTITGVTNQDQLLIGSLENINVSSKSKNRHNFSDIVVKIVALNDPNRTTKVSILGDSISTFKGWCDTSRGGAYYPKSDGDVTSVSDTWWHRLIYQKMSTGIFEKNISAGNTTVVQNSTGDSGAYWYGWDFGTRVQQLGLGDPDVILIFGGTNDYGHTLYNSTSEELIDGVAMGAESIPSSSEARLAELLSAADEATTVAAADALDGSTFTGAYIRLIRMLQVRYPSAKIVCIIGDYLYYGLGDAIRKVVAHFPEDEVRAVDILGEYGYKANSSSGIPKYDYAHPNAAGMAKIADFVYSEVGSWIDSE